MKETEEKLRCGYRCCYAGRNRPTAQQFEAVDIGFRNDLRALERSRHFLMILPETVVSSVLVEAGMTIVFGKPSVCFKRPEAQLPFVLRGAINSGNRDRARIRMYEYRDTAELTKIVQVNGVSLFEIDP